MGITNSNKLVNTDRVDCEGTLKVTLAITAAPDIVSNPTDMVLVLDRSGSMTGSTGSSTSEYSTSKHTRPSSANTMALCFAIRSRSSSRKAASLSVNFLFISFFFDFN